jgi:hypothetical protein
MDQSLMEKLAISKKIMDKHDGIPTGGVNPQSSNQINESNYNVPEANYNIPNIKPDPMDKSINEDAVMNSNLPDEIKRLMIENPIQKPSQQKTTLSNDIIEGAAKLINKNRNPSNNQSQQPTVSNDLKETIRNIVRDTVRDTVIEVIKEELKDKVILSESGKDVKDKLTFKVGSHIFEGYVTKIKKIK